MTPTSVVAVIQARLTSSRLPGKVLLPIGGKPVVDLIFERVRRARQVNQVVFCIPDTPTNQPLFEHVAHVLQAPVIMGPEDDVLSRFVAASRAFPARYYVRLTADCPFACPDIIDAVVGRARSLGLDYASNVDPPTFPDGFDVECISKEALNWSDQHVTSPKEREHVTLGFRTSTLRPAQMATGNVLRSGGLLDLRITLDEPRDYEALTRLGEALGPERLTQANAQEIENLYISLGLQRINGRITRNEGLLTMRRATKADARFLFDLRNEPAVRQASFTSEVVEWDHHVAWVDAKLGDASCLLLIAEHGGTAIGQVRFDLSADGCEGEVSLALKYEFRGKGLGHKILAKAYALAKGIGVRRSIAYVKEDNAASLAVFRKAGYQSIGTVTNGGNPSVKLILETET